MIGNMPLVLLFGPKRIYDTELLSVRRELTILGSVVLVPDDMENLDKMRQFLSSADRAVMISLDGTTDEVCDKIDHMIRDESMISYEVYHYTRAPGPRRKSGHTYVWHRSKIEKVR